MLPELNDRVALVTGGARRVGACIARTLHASGARVAIHYRASGAEAAALVDELNARRRESAIALQADILSVPSLGALVDAVLATFGRLDVLVNNASSFYPTPVGEITLAHWDDLVGTNLRAPLFLAQAAAAALRTSHGLIVNITDIHGQRPLRHHPVYSAAKAGLIMLTQSLARELAPEVRVNAVAPGPILFPSEGIDPEIEQEILSRTLLKRRGAPEDVAAAVLFFATRAPYVTGQMLAVDGGRSARG